MCHHYQVEVLLADDFVAWHHARLPLFEMLSPYLSDLKNSNAWPLKRVPALRLDAKGELEAFGPEWGLLPSWWKPSDRTPKRFAFQRKTINARSETAAEKPSFREAWKHRRCLLPVSRFEEKKHYFSLEQPVAFAGLWESWLGKDGPIETTTLLTTLPNAEIEAVGHHRMPCLLTTPEMRAKWLEEGAESSDAEMLSPLKDGLLKTEPQTKKA